MTPQNILVLLICFLLGSLPFSIIIGRLFYDTDVREHGSGNPGATNTLRTLGTGAGLIVLALDILKGIAAVIIAWNFLAGTNLYWLDKMTLGGGLAILGHIYSPFLHFKGGKGVATTVGVMVTLSVSAGFAAIVLFVILVAIFRYVSLGSILAVLFFGILYTLSHEKSQVIIIFSASIFLIVTYKHKSNIQRLIHGTESKFSLKKMK